MCLDKLIKFKQMINTDYRAKSNGLWVYGDLYNNCDRGVNQNFIVRDKRKYRDWRTHIG